LGVLKSDNFEYKIKKREITMGRSSDKQSVDIDLTNLIIESKKVSRNQGAIKFDENGNFFIYNNSDRPIYVDGEIFN
jgi:hypothetical protein